MHRKKQILDSVESVIIGNSNWLNGKGDREGQVNGDCTLYYVDTLEIQLARLKSE